MVVRLFARLLSLSELLNVVCVVSGSFDAMKEFTDSTSPDCSRRRLHTSQSTLIMKDLYIQQFLWIRNPMHLQPLNTEAASCASSRY